jgi:hypothetical protein
MTNEFEEMYNKDDFNNVDVGTNTKDEFSDNNNPEDDLIAPGNESLEYDFKRAPKTTKGPDRVSLDGQTVTIVDAKIILPSPESEWELSKNKKVRYKNCQFILYYDKESQREYYSGMKVFERIVDGNVRYSDPVIHNKASNQASLLKQAYATFKGKKPEEISMNEFLAFLMTKPKAKIEYKEFEYDNKFYHKNIVKEFV